MKGFIGLVIVFILVFGITSCNLQIGVGAPPQPEIPSTTAIPMVIANVAASCLAGPGQGYDVIGTLDPGQEAQVVGRSMEGDYWLILYPPNPATLCWLDGASVTVTGNPVLLPVSTPPPTPTLVVTPVVGGCPSPVPSGPTPVSCGAPPPGSGCPSPVPSGPTPVSCGGPPPASGCPSPVPSGPTPVSCSGPPPGGGGSGCPSPVPSGPTPVSCSGPPPGGGGSGSGCPSPVPSGPTPVSCGGPPPGSGCPSPVPSGPTPVSCYPLK